jgi:hypothetical protein
MTSGHQRMGNGDTGHVTDGIAEDLAEDRAGTVPMPTNSVTPT